MVLYVDHNMTNEQQSLFRKPQHTIHSPEFEEVLDKAEIVLCSDLPISSDNEDSKPLEVLNTSNTKLSPPQ